MHDVLGSFATACTTIVTDKSNFYLEEARLLTHILQNGKRKHKWLENIVFYVAELNGNEWSMLGFSRSLIFFYMKSAFVLQFKKSSHSIVWANFAFLEQMSGREWKGILHRYNLCEFDMSLVKSTTFDLFDYCKKMLLTRNCFDINAWAFELRWERVFHFGINRAAALPTVARTASVLACTLLL